MCISTELRLYSLYWPSAKLITPSGPFLTGILDTVCFTSYRLITEDNQASEYMPQCTPQGLFAKLQCQTERGCLCVDETTGSVLFAVDVDPNTATPRQCDGVSTRGITTNQIFYCIVCSHEIRRHILIFHLYGIFDFQYILTFVLYPLWHGFMWIPNMLLRCQSFLLGKCQSKIIIWRISISKHSKHSIYIIDKKK